MRILHYTDRLDNDGLAGVLTTLANGFADDDEVHVLAEAGGGGWSKLNRNVTRQPYAALSREWAYSKNRVIRPAVAVARLISAAWSLWRLVRREEFDIIHSHQRKHALLAQIVAGRSRTRLVEHVHNVFRPDWRRRVSFKSDLVIACGRGIGHMLERDFTVPVDRLAVVPNGVANRSSSREGRQARRPDGALGSEGEPQLRIVTVAGLTAQKDPIYWLKVMEALESRGVQFRATWVGGGELAQRVRAVVQSSSVRFVGQVEDPLRFLRDANIFFLTSRWEGLPLAALEAASAGLGLFLPNVGSCPELLTDTDSGWLYDRDSEPDQVAALLAAVSTVEMAQKGQAARALYEKAYTQEAMIAGVRSAYQRLPDDPSRGHGSRSRAS